MTTSTTPTFYTARQLADMFQMKSTNLIDRGVASGELPHLRVGKRAIRFTDEHVAKIARIFEANAKSKGSGSSSGSSRRRRSDVDLSGVAVSSGSRRRHAANPS